MERSNELIEGLSVVRDGANGLYRVDYEWTMDVDPSTVVTTAVASLAGVGVEELPPLNGTVDPDALDELFRPRRNEASRGIGEVRFSFAGYDVTLHTDGTIRLRERSASTGPS